MRFREIRETHRLTQLEILAEAQRQAELQRELEELRRNDESMLQMMQQTHLQELNAPLF